MAKSNQQIEAEIDAELGGRGKDGLLANAASRLCGVLQRNGADWDKAYEHIQEHFRPRLDKPSHALFKKKYRDKESLRQLLFRAASAPSGKRLTKLTAHGDNSGKPAVEIHRVFGEPVGELPCQTMLRIFVDFQGNLITAYPSE